MRVLVIDDDPAALRGIKRELDYLQIQGSTCAGEALEHLLAFEPDVVLCDFMMPGVNGIELIEMIKSMRPGTRCVLMTGLPVLPDDVTAADAVIARPWMPADIRGALFGSE